MTIEPVSQSATQHQSQGLISYILSSLAFNFDTNIKYIMDLLGEVCYCYIQCSWLANGAEIFIWKLVPPVGHCSVQLISGLWIKATLVLLL